MNHFIISLSSFQLHSTNFFDDDADEEALSLAHTISTRCHAIAYGDEKWNKCFVSQGRRDEALFHPTKWNIFVFYLYFHLTWIIIDRHHRWKEKKYSMPSQCRFVNGNKKEQFLLLFISRIIIISVKFLSIFVYVYGVREFLFSSSTV